jgi:putative transposase
VRHTTFQYAVRSTAGVERRFARHVGASRFAFNQALRLHVNARTRGGERPVPWSGFDLINAFNAWKKTEDAGRRFVTGPGGEIDVEVTGLRWRGEVCQQVFEEAAVDVGRALGAWTGSRRGKRAGRRVGHPRFKRKNEPGGSFRIRNKTTKSGRSQVRVGEGHPRSVTLPGVGTVRVCDDTRPLRRLLAKGRGKILFATVRRHGDRWTITLNVEAADLHASRRHQPSPDGGWVGVDRGLHALVVAATADGTETLRMDDPPRALRRGLAKQRRLARAVTRKPRGSGNHRDSARRLRTHHRHVASVRTHFIHQLTNRLVKTHAQLVIEDLNIRGMLANPRLARHIADAAWGELHRQLAYKAAWTGGLLMLADRWLPSSKTCSGCGAVREHLTLAERTFQCEQCGLSIDRDLNAAVNLAAWAERHAQAPERQAGARDINAHREARTGPRPRVGETSLDEVGTHPHAITA